MKHTRLVIALLSMVIGSANKMHAQEPTPKTGPVVSVPDLSKLSIGNMLEQMQTTIIAGNGVQQRVQLLEALLNSGGNPANVGMLVIQIHTLQQQVAQAQQDFLSKFMNLLDLEQQQRLEAIRIAAQLQPILPAFQQLYLF